MDIAAMLGNMMGVIYSLGMTVHIMLGVLVFPLVYVLLFQFLPGAPFVKGLLFGTALWPVPAFSYLKSVALKQPWPL
jgi:hypothetical protein